MSQHALGRWMPKRRRTNKMPSPLPDLNSPPAEGAGEGGSPSISAPASHGQTSGVAVSGTSQLLAPPVAAGTQIGMNSSPIDVEAIDDDVVIYSSRSLPQARQQSSRTVPITVIIDDDSETTPGPAGEALDEHVNTLLSLGRYPWSERLRASNKSPVINLLDESEIKSIAVPSEPVKEGPKEPKFSCPVCMNELVNASSTICGHIFCQKCIRASIQAQKKCPTCRRKLTMTNFHRVYLPTTD